MRIIEITGVAGAGKSYILTELLKDKFVISDIELIKKYNIKDIYLLYLFFKSKNSWELFQVILDIAKELNFSFFDKINFIRNTVKKIGKNYYLSKTNFIDDRVVLVDEGILHIYQNVVTSKTQNNLKILILLNRFISLVQLPDEVIVVDASTQTIIERLKKRGHKRLKSMEELKIFVENSKKNLSVIYKKVSNVKTIINENSTDLESLEFIIKGREKCINYQKI